MPNWYAEALMPVLMLRYCGPRSMNSLQEAESSWGANILRALGCTTTPKAFCSL